MSRMRTALVFTVLIALAASGLAMADDAQTQQLEQRLDALEKRMASLEQNLARQLRTLQSQIAQSGAAAPSPLEAEAEQAYSKILQASSAGDMNQAKTLMDSFMGKYAATQTAKKARRMHQELQVIGKGCPTDWGIQKWFQGEDNIDLSSNKTTLLVFWEEWCPHCRREVPKIDGLYNSLKGSGLQVVGLTRLSKNTPEEKVESFLEQQKVSYPIAKENGATARHFNVSGIPAAAVVKDGKIIWRGHPNRLNEAMLRGWL